MKPEAERPAFFIAALLVLVACGGGADTTGSVVPTPEPVFSVPRHVVVNTFPYLSAEEAVGDAANIDWDNDPDGANAAAQAFAAREIEEHLALLGIDVEFRAPAEATGRSELLLVLRDDAASQALLSGATVDYGGMEEQGFEIGWIDDSIYVTATTSTGILYGVYRLLEHIGFAWYQPGEISMPSGDVDAIRWQRIRQQPRVARRGFWIFGDQPLPEDYTVWLARNRFNIAANVEPYLGSMLGIREWGGGHDLLQQEFSKPGLFEQHPEYFSVVNGVRRPVTPTGTYFNPAFGEPAAAEYFAGQLIERLAGGDLANVDVLNVWPADSRGGRFDESALAASIGNPTDNLLHFYGTVAARLRQGQDDGVLDRRVTLGGISYYETWQPPTNAAVVAALEDADYLHVFYLNERSWSGPIDSALGDRDANRELLANLDAWESSANLPFGFVEYYNYSVYAAIALSDIEFIASNYRALVSGGGDLFGYMHPLLNNPGPRRLTNELLAKLGWDTVGTGDIDRQAYFDAITSRYFSRRYGSYDTEWREVYSLMAMSVENAAEIFGLNSLYWLLFQEYLWTQRPYSTNEVVAFIPLYRNGGAQDLPTFPERGFRRASFRGLDESIQLQTVAASRWQSVLEQSLDPAVRSNLEADVAWFEATRSRYRLMAASADFVVGTFNGSNVSNLRDSILDEIAFLESSPTTDDTLSPVDQRAFLDFHRRLILAD